jgi:hypothetical protein
MSPVTRPGSGYAAAAGSAPASNAVRQRNRRVNGARAADMVPPLAVMLFDDTAFEKALSRAPTAAGARDGYSVKKPTAS